MCERQKEYARLLVGVGLNVQRGQTVVVRAPIQCAGFVRLCAEAAYDAGCREVVHIWQDDALNRMRYLRAADGVFDEYPDWQADKLNTLAREGAAFLSIHADDPDALNGVEPGRIVRSEKAAGPKIKEYRQILTNNKARWCVGAVPSVAWAKKVFPDKTEEEAMAALADAIFAAVRITGDGRALERWQAHIESLQTRCMRLNGLDLAALHYKNGLGTDLRVGLPGGAIWLGGAETCAKGVPFVANMPTEEIFTAPKRDDVNGTVVSSMPFSLHGNVIKQFTLTLKDGKIVDVKAGSAEEEALLGGAVAVDEGAAYLGEVALVPYDSPIANQGILFYNTLFDENASCHFAFGRAYPCVKGGDTMTQEQLKAAGLNDSITHKDFMVGTGDLSITGETRDGQKIPIFVNGKFAI